MASMDTLSGGSIEPRGLEEEMRSSYLDYAMSVIVGRALPDVRDGLKPVHRRVLFAMHESGLQPNRPYRKCANVVGGVMGNFHPHGDQAIYDTLVRLAQDFAQRYPLVDGQGNFGSIDNDPAAAMRYTEARLARLATEMLRDIDADTVDFGPNYDESRMEPAVLPSRFPNLLVNGASGIAVGMATNLPPHNLRETIDAVVAYIDDPELGTVGLMKHVKGPDFPTGGIIKGISGIRDAYESGRGRVVVQARAHIEPLRQGKEAIIVTELPYQVTKGDGRNEGTGLIKKIAEVVNDKKIPEISDLRDESDKSGIRVVIELKRDVNPRVVLNKLYKHTPMQSTYGVNMVALVDGVPRTLGLEAMIRSYVDPRREVTEINASEEDIDIEDRIADQQMVIAITNSGYIKSLPLDTYRKQKRGGVGVTGMDMKDDDYIEHLFVTSTHDFLLFFTNRGKVYRQKVYELPEASRTARGRALVNLLPLREGEFVQAVLSTRDFSEGKYLVFATRKGMVKKTDFKSYNTPIKADGIIAIKIRDDDELVAVRRTGGDDDIIMVSRSGQAARFSEKQVRPMGRDTSGVRGMNVSRGDNRVLAMDIARDDTELLVVTENGYGKRTAIAEYPVKGRGTMGVKTITLTEKKGGLAGALIVREHHELVFISQAGMVQRTSVRGISKA